MNLQPFVKWAGGKRQLLPEILKRMPENFNGYYEPFIGGGALLFELKPERATINDINPHLIYTYNTIKDNAEELIKILEKWDKSETTKEKYYQVRDIYNKKILKEDFDIEMAAMFIYLNKRCFNGLYRVNSKGLFNVPFNNKKKVNSFDEENILNISKYLKKVNIKEGDFEEALMSVSKSDFVFLDSPYAPLNPTSFSDYAKQGFDIGSHERLAKVFKELDRKGCYIMLTNHDTKLIRDLYKDYNMENVKAKRMINSDSTKRFATELIVRNYE